MSDGALDGVKVVDLGHHVAGPYCAKLLADFGAEVIKVERPDGDPARRTPPFFNDEPHPEKSLLFTYLNSNKMGVTLNLKSQKGREILRELVQDADILVESFSPRVMPSLNLDYESLHELNPKLVMVSISSFGQTGPYRDFRAQEIVLYALGGLMYIFGAYDREPLKHALRQAQFRAGTDAASAALIALYRQRATANGQHVDVSIQECIVSALRDVVSNYSYTGAVRRRHPVHRGDLTELRNLSDGYLLTNLTGMSRWRAMAEFLGDPEMLDEKFSTPESRQAHADELGRIIDRCLAGKEKLDVFDAAQKQRFTFGVVQSPEEVMENSQYRARGYFREIPHPELGPVLSPGAPFLMSRTPWGVRRPSPTLGQHNSELLGNRFSYSGKDLAILRAAEEI